MLEPAQTFFYHSKQFNPIAMRWYWPLRQNVWQYGKHARCPYAHLTMTEQFLRHPGLIRTRRI